MFYQQCFKKKKRKEKLIKSLALIRFPKCMLQLNIAHMYNIFVQIKNHCFILVRMRKKEKFQNMETSSDVFRISLFLLGGLCLIPTCKFRLNGL